MILLLVLDITGFILLSLASVLLLMVVIKNFRGMKVPAFWMYIIAAFYLSVTASFVDAALGQAELTQAIRLVSNAFIFMGIYGAYKRMSTAV